MRIPRAASIGRDISGALADLAQARVTLGRRVLGVQQGWQTPALLSGLTDTYSGDAPVGYYRDSFGFVHLRGTVTGDVSAGSAIFVLPPYYRPDRVIRPPAGLCAYVPGATGPLGSGRAMIADLQILPDGRVLTYSLGLLYSHLGFVLLSLDTTTFDARIAAA